MYRKGTFRMPDGREVVWEDGGKMSDYLDTKRAGDRIEIMGPTGMHEYMGCGSYKVPGNTISSKHFGLLAGGTGLTPMLQLISAALKDPNDTTTFSMIYANKTEDDILCREDMEEMARTSNGRFKLHYTLDFPPENWTHKRGFITQDMIKECLPAPNLDPIIVMCGPPPMIQHACKANLEALGYNKKLWVAY
jgi:cytochrome-b5 reductase